MKILVITAHPDDVDFGAGGTISSWIAEGHEVVYCLVTDGQAGGSERRLVEPRFLPEVEGGRGDERRRRDAHRRGAG